MTTPMPVRETPQGLTPEQAAILASQAAYEAKQEQLRQALIAAMLGIWAGVAAARAFSPLDAARFVARMLPISIGAQRAMSALTVAKLSEQVRPPRPIRVLPEAVTTPEVLRGKPAEVVYARPFSEIRWQLSQGKTVEQAIDSGRRRAESIFSTDLQLAKTHTAREYIDRAAESPNSTVVGFRRILSSKPNHCALCILASTQRYRSFDLMPIHPGCGCDVGPIIGTSDPGQIIDPALAGRVHEIVRRDLGQSYVDPGGRLGDAHYRDIVIVNDHGEMGPVLGVRGQNFAGNYLPHRRINPTDEDIADAS